MLSVKSINKSICKSELLIIWPLFYFYNCITKSSQMINNSDLHTYALVKVTVYWKLIKIPIKRMLYKSNRYL